MRTDTDMVTLCVSMCSMSTLILVQRLRMVSFVEQTKKLLKTATEPSRRGTQAVDAEPLHQSGLDGAVMGEE
jgi:hypothetical protein